MEPVDAVLEATALHTARRLDDLSEAIHEHRVLSMTTATERLGAALAETRGLLSSAAPVPATEHEAITAAEAAAVSASMAQVQSQWGEAMDIINSSDLPRSLAKAKKVSAMARKGAHRSTSGFERALLPSDANAIPTL
jgi:hypothetical protein